jgi:hypothetical protein
MLEDYYKSCKRETMTVDNFQISFNANFGGYQLLLRVL